MDVKSLYGDYLNYITNVYFRSIPGQEVFAGAGTNPISIYWGFDDIKNKTYYVNYWNSGNTGPTIGEINRELATQAPR